MKTPDYAKQFGWWWRDADNEFVITPKGGTSPNPVYRAGGPADSKILWEIHGAKMMVGEEKRAKFQFWKDGFESASHAYELVRRIHPELNLRPFPDLTALQQGGLKVAIGKSMHLYVTRQNSKPFNQLLNDPNYSHPIQFNLRASDSALMTAFSDYIKEQRAIKNISGKPEVPPKNSVSWKWIEVWDLSEKAGKALSNSEHSMKTRAKKRAEEIAPAVLEAIRTA